MSCCVKSDVEAVVVDSNKILVTSNNKYYYFTNLSFDPSYFNKTIYVTFTIKKVIQTKNNVSKIFDIIHIQNFHN